MDTPATEVSSPTARRELWVVLGLVLALVSLRLLLAAAGSNTVERGEEFARAAAASALVGGLDLPLARLFYHPYEGGGFVHALLTAGVMQVLGPSLLTHKLIAIGWEALVLLAGLLLVREAFGRRAAGLFGLLWVLAPLAFQKLALLNLGIHYQALLFQFLLAWCGLGLLRGEPRRALLAGLVGGFGLFYNYQLAAMIGLLGLALLVTRSIGPKAWGRLVLGFVVGGLPLWLMAMAVGTEVLDIHGQSLGETKPDATSVGEVLRAMGASFGPRAWLQLLLLGGLTLAPLVMGSLGRAEPPARMKTRRLLSAYLIVFALAAALTGFLSAGFHDYFGAMRYSPLYAFALVLSAGTIAALVESGGARRLTGSALAGVLLLLGGSSSLAARAEGYEPSPLAGLANLAAMHGWDFHSYYSKLAPRLELEDHEKVALLSAVEGVPRDVLLPAVGEAVYRQSDRSLTEIIQDLQRVAPEAWREYLPGFGRWLIRAHYNDMNRPIERLHSQLQDAVDAGVVQDPVPVRRALREALGRSGLGYYPTDEVMHGELGQMLELGLPPRVYHGFGERALRAYLTAPGRVETLLQGYPDQAATWVRTGFDAAVERRRLADG